MARGARRFIRPPARSMVWLNAGIALSTVTAGTATLLSVMNAAALALRPFTVVRNRIMIWVQSDQTGTTEFVQGAFGQIVVKETASSIGATAVPSPLAETDAEWIVFQPFMNLFEFVSGVGVFEHGGQGSSYTIDSKAMRKVGIDEDLVTVCENRLTGYDIAIEGRTLIKLH